MATRKKKPDKDRVAVLVAVAKMFSYRAVGNLESAKVWANTVVAHLKRLGLVE